MQESNDEQLAVFQHLLAWWWQKKEMISEWLHIAAWLCIMPACLCALETLDHGEAKVYRPRYSNKEALLPSEISYQWGVCCSKSTTRVLNTQCPLMWPATSNQCSGTKPVDRDLGLPSCQPREPDCSEAAPEADVHKGSRSRIGRCFLCCVSSCSDTNCTLPLIFSSSLGSNASRSC